MAPPAPEGFASSANAAVAAALTEIATLLRLQRSDRFRVRAYRDAGLLVAGLPVDLAALAPEQRRRLRGVGRAVARVVEQVLAEGRSDLLEELRASEPPGVGVLLQVQGVSPRIGRTLAAAGVDGIPALARLAHRGELADVAGVGPTTAEVIVEGLRRLDLAGAGRLVLRRARLDAEVLAAALLEADPHVAEVAVAGDVRRGVAQPDGIDLVATSADPPGTLDAAASLDATVAVLDRGADHVAVLTTGGRLATVHATAPAAVGTTLVVATGPADHVAALRARGLPAAARDEAAAYTAAGLHPVPPTWRDRPGILDRAAAGPLPRPVQLRDLRGDAHVHSRWSGDGHEELATLADAAVARGYEWVAVTDHAEDLRIAGMSRAELAERDQAIAAVNAARDDVVLLRGLELNIGVDGGLDYDDDLLGGMELTVASVHSAFRLGQAAQTERILAAVAHPAVDVIGHPTGRMLGVRPGYRIDLAAIAEAAAATGTALEVNGSPRRLDLDAELVAVALEAGALLAVSSDAHRVGGPGQGELDYVVEGILTAQRGGATADRVITTWPLERVRAWRAARLAGRAGIGGGGGG